MFFTVAFLFLISISLAFGDESCYLTDEMEDQCASVCYPIVKPLLRYFEICQNKDNKNSELQKQYSDLQVEFNKNHHKYEECLEQYIKINENNKALQERFESQTSVIKQELNEVKNRYVNEQVFNLELQKRVNEYIQKFAELQNQNRQLALDLSKSQEDYRQCNSKMELKRESESSTQQNEVMIGNAPINLNDVFKCDDKSADFLACAQDFILRRN